MIVDRVEGSVAVVEVSRGSFLDVPLSQISGRVRDGAVLRRDGNGYVIDEEETVRRSRSVRGRLDSLFS